MPESGTDRTIEEIIADLRFIAHDLRVLGFQGPACDLDDTADELEETETA